MMTATCAFPHTVLGRQQPESPSAPGVQTGPDQDQIIRELLRRLDAQEAVNAELLRRLAALEAVQKGALPPAATPAATPEAPPVPPIEERLAAAEETAERNRGLIDAMPKLIGYYDFEFFREGEPGTFAEFRQHHVFLDVLKEYEKFRVLSEFEFEYAPLLDGRGGQQIREARGEVSIEQAWAEYTTSDAFILRAGFLLTPNYWNVNHYPNVIVSTRPPLMVRNVYPESWVGIMAYGAKYWGGFGLGYHVYAHNGESADSGRHDTNNAKAVGGVLTFDLPKHRLFDTFKIGVNGYVDTPANNLERTRTWGLESQLRRGPFEVLAEFARRRAVENRSGVYLQPSYRVSSRWLAFYRYDRLFVDPAGETQANTLGANFRPIPSVSLKFEAYRTRRPARGFNGIASSFAVAF